jgi:hypothetical protein
MWAPRSTARVFVTIQPALMLSRKNSANASSIV